MTSSPLRVAIIGAARWRIRFMLRTTAPATIWNWWLSVTAAFPRRRRWQKIRECILWDDPQAMLLAVKPDVVSVGSPNRFHYEHTLMALEAGCHVMCEKPPAMTTEQAWEMCDTARKLGKVLAYDFHHRLRSIRNSCVNR
ncbi:Gfo/Idh/MocA family protein [Shigella flexneri]